MKAVMISIRPEFVEKIISGEKTIEVRKIVPKLETPFKCFIYVTQGKLKELLYENRMKVIGEFVCDSISEIKPHNDGYGANSYTFMSIEYNKGGNGSCLNFEQLNDYLKGRKGYALHISDLKIYDKPKEISEFLTVKGEIIKRPFQSWGYINA